MNWDDLLKKLWPLLKPRLAAQLARVIRKKFPAISEAEALDLALFALNLLDDLWDDAAVDPLVAEATQKLSAHA